MGTSGLLTVFCSYNSLLSMKQQILKFEGLDEISVPDERAIFDAYMCERVVDLADLVNTLRFNKWYTFLKCLINSENSSVSLHIALHVTSN